MPDYTDYGTITPIKNTLKNKEKSVESFFQICVIRERKVFLQSSQQKNLTTQLIIDIWESTSREKKEQIIQSKREGGDGKGPLVLNEFFSK